VNDGRPELDVVVVNFRSAPLIGTTIAIAREFAGAAAHLIVVDNSPGDGAADVVRRAEPDATLIANPVNRGYAAAVNQGLAVSHADLALLLNPDVQAISGSYADVVAAFREGRVGAVVPRLLNADGTMQPSCICAPRPFDMISEDVALSERFPRWQRPRRYRMLDWDQHDERRVDAATGACLFLSRPALSDVGAFDERFFVYYEETDWLIRAKRRGWETVFLPAIEAVHASAASSPGVRSRPSLLLLESQHRYARKHFGPFTTALLRTTLVGIDTARLARHALAGRTDGRAEALDRIRVHVTMRAPRPS
jgi:GT2 family glycosyltransferase